MQVKYIWYLHTYTTDHDHSDINAKQIVSSLSNMKYNQDIIPPQSSSKFIYFQEGWGVRTVSGLEVFEVDEKMYVMSAKGH